MSVLAISEVFGPTIQGEGPRAGRVCSFIRFGGCNLSCSWCDSGFTWNAEKYDLRDEIGMLSSDVVMGLLPPAPEVVLTGGEPLLHQENPEWGQLLRKLFRKGFFINLETNGTIVPNATTMTFVQHYSISPKLANAGMHKRSQSAEMAEWPQQLRYGQQTTCLKFVVEDAADVARAARYAQDRGWPLHRVYVMPEGMTAPAVLERWPEIVNAAIENGVQVTQRLHVLAWGDKRGV